MIRSVSVPLAVSITIGTSEAAPKLPADVAPVSVGQSQVEQDEIGLEPLGQLQGLGGGPGDDRLEPGSLEGLREGLRDGVLVLDEEDAAALHLAGHRLTVARASSALRACGSNLSLLLTRRLAAASLAPCTLATWFPCHLPEEETTT